MTDSMKFGPEWLRNMATDNVTGIQASGGGGGALSTSSAASTNLNNNGTSSSSYQQQQQLQQQVPQLHVLQARGLFPEFRYGREEMLSLFNKNCNMPEILTSFKKLFIDKVQYPLALTPSTEEEVFTQAAQPVRPQWLQRSPVAFNSTTRVPGRGGSVDRGRLRGKAMYHVSAYPRPTPMFEDDARNIKPERVWSERNGAAGEGPPAGAPDWSVSPSSSPRKDFSTHSTRNLENWRRSRNDEESTTGANGPPPGGNVNSGLSVGPISGSTGGAGGDGWRGPASNNFGNTRWGRSTSWRDEDNGSGGLEPNTYTMPPMQRSYSTIATTERTYFSGLSKSSSLTSANAGGPANIGGANDPLTKSNASGTTSRHHHQNSANHQWDTEDMLPEWAMENPTDGGGTFDATGAFHGSVDEDDEKHMDGESGSSSTTSSSSLSNKKQNTSLTKHDDSKEQSKRKTSPKIGKKILVVQERPRQDAKDSNEQRVFEDVIPTADSLTKNVTQRNKDISSPNKMESSEENASILPSTKVSSATFAHTASITNSLNTSNVTTQSTHKIPFNEYSDRMQEVADDMVEKLIMDDDNVARNSQKPSVVSSGPSAPPVTSGKVATSLTSLNSAVSNNPSAAAMYKSQVLTNKTIYLPQVDAMQHHLQQETAVSTVPPAIVPGLGSNVPPLGTRMLPPPITKPSNELWFYRDPQSKVQGPFTAMEMIEWYRAGYFDENLYVRRMCDNRFAALGDLIKLCGQMPFQSSHLIPPLQTEVPSISNSIPIIPTHELGHPVKDSAEIGSAKSPNPNICDLKGSVTATADSLSAAVKNMLNPVDVPHMLNAHFQMLQQQYMHRQEMLILAEFSKKETFNRLSPSERAAVVRQKVHMLGLPEHLTSLAGLSNSLAALNPTAGNQLYDVIAQCSKKDAYVMSPLEKQLQQFQQHLQQPQVQQQSQNSYLEPDDFLQQQQSNQQGEIYQRVPYRSAFSQMEGAGSNLSGEEQLNADIISELNLRMMLRQGRLRPGRENEPVPPHMNATTNDFGSELLSRTAPQVLASTVVNMMPQWPPHMLPHGPIAQQQPISQQNHQPPVSANQWPSIPTPRNIVPQMQVTVGKPPVTMWAVDSDTQILLQQPQPPQHQVDVIMPKMEDNFVPTKVEAVHRQQDANSNNIENAREEIKEADIGPEINSNISVLPENATLLTPSIEVDQGNVAANTRSKNKVEKAKPTGAVEAQILPNISAKQGSTFSSTNVTNSSNSNAKRNAKQKSNEKQVEPLKSKPHQTQSASSGGIEEERRKETAEEKRKQKEERKRQQQEEEKKRLQVAEEEKRRQAFEEKERQKEIHAHRRKAMLSGGGSSTNLGSYTNITAVGRSSASGLSNAASKQSSIAPWSLNTHASTVSNPGPSLAEIQKAERRERRADQQRLTELMEKQMRLSTAAEASDNVLKWNAAPVAVKSLAEIQAEEAKRLASEQAANSDLQRRKEQEQVNSAPTNSLSTNPFAMIWSGSKVWGTGNSTSGFWEEPAKFPSSSTATSSSSAPFVAKIAGQSSASGGSNITLPNKQSASIGGNTSSAVSNTSRHIGKSQTVPTTMNSNWTTVNMSNNANQAKSQQQSFAVSQQMSAIESIHNANKGKKSKSIIGNSSTATSSISLASTFVSNNNVNKNDDFRNEFTGWCMKSLNSMNTKVDVPTFVSFLQDLESPYEVKDYIRMYLGESKEYTEFGKQFLERRSKYKNLQRAQNAHIDDMCKPAPAINPSGNDSFDNKGKPKKVKKSKMTKLDARILGFSVTAAEGRINVGDRDYGDAS